MSISVFIFAAIAVLLALLLIAAGYFLVCAVHLNKAQSEKDGGRSRRIPPHKAAAVFAGIFLACAGIITAVLVSGAGRTASAGDIEENLRESCSVDEDWNAEVAVSGDYAAAIAYDDEHTDHVFAVYRNEGGGLTNYVFRYGGHSSSVEWSVKIYKFDGALVLISMNSMNIAKIERHDGETCEIDPERPFVLILPDGGFDVYDSGNEPLDLEQDDWYEICAVD